MAPVSRYDHDALERKLLFTHSFPPFFLYLLSTPIISWLTNQPSLNKNRAAQRNNPIPLPNPRPSIRLRHQQWQQQQHLHLDAHTPLDPIQQPEPLLLHPRQFQLQFHILARRASERDPRARAQPAGGAPGGVDADARGEPPAHPARADPVRRGGPQPGHLHAGVRRDGAPQQPDDARQAAGVRVLPRRPGRRDGEGHARAEGRRRPRRGCY